MFAQPTQTTPFATDATETGAVAVVKRDEETVTRQLPDQPWDMPLPQPAADSAYTPPSAADTHSNARSKDMAPAVKGRMASTTLSAASAGTGGIPGAQAEKTKGGTIARAAPRLVSNDSNDVRQVLPTQPWATPTTISMPMLQPPTAGRIPSAAAGLQSTAEAMPLAPDAAQSPASFTPQPPTTAHATFPPLSGMKMAQSAAVLEASATTAHCKGMEVASTGSGPSSLIPGAVAAACGAATAVSAAAISPMGSTNVPRSVALGRLPQAASVTSSTTAWQVGGPAVKPSGAPFPERSCTPAVSPSVQCKWVEDESVDSALAFGLGATLSISSEGAGQAATHGDASSRISSALKRESESATVPSAAAGRGADMVMDALSDCMGQLLTLDAPTPSEEEAAFIDGVAVRGELGRAIVAMKKEERERKEAEVRTILGDVRRRRSKRLRSAALAKGREVRKAPPSWDHFSLRKMWKSEQMLTL